MFGATRFGASAYGGDENVELIEKHAGFGTGSAASPSDASSEAAVPSFGTGTSTTGEA